MLSVLPLGVEGDLHHIEDMIPYSIAKEVARAQVVEWQRAAASSQPIRSQPIRVRHRLPVGWAARLKGAVTPGGTHLRRRRVTLEDPTCAT
jgi:hypothetical protein